MEGETARLAKTRHIFWICISYCGYLALSVDSEGNGDGCVGNGLALLVCNLDHDVAQIVAAGVQLSSIGSKHKFVRLSYRGEDYIPNLSFAFDMRWPSVRRGCTEW